ncbi:MAG: methyltransferase domain-containing protein [Gammaproteobacteria bacterium]|jgi:SAM-dependent methyltransferase
MPAEGAPLKLFDLLEGFHLAHLVRCLHDEGLLEQLTQWRSVEELVDSSDLDRETLRLLLWYAAQRSDLIQENNNRYRLAEPYQDLQTTGFLIDQYLGAYAPNALNLSQVIRNPATGGDWVDRAKHSMAFNRLERPGFRVLPDVIKQLSISSLLDLGCGAGTLLTALAKEDNRIHAWGIEQNEAMVAMAEERIAYQKLERQITIIHGDCQNIEQYTTDTIRNQVQAICSASLLNEFFLHGNEKLVDWLQRLRQLFPKRLLIVADYYGRLGHQCPEYSRHGLLHDFIQAISGQGVPPPDTGAWEQCYQQAGARLIKSVDGEGGVPWFVHLVAL